MGYLQNVKTSLIEFVRDYNKNKIISFSEKKKNERGSGGGRGTDGMDRDALHYVQLIFSDSTRLTEKYFVFKFPSPREHS